MTEATSAYLNQPLRTEDQVRKFLKKPTCNTCVHWSGPVPTLGPNAHVCDIAIGVAYADYTCEFHDDDWLEEHV